jgi:hypothetical protein
MMMTLVMVVLKDKYLYTWVHSNFHHLKIARALAPHFKYNFLGTDVGNSNHLSPEELFDKINRSNNPYDASRAMEDWKEGKDLRNIQNELDHFSGYILIDYTFYGEDFSSDNIYINISTTEHDTEEEEQAMLEQFKLRFKGIMKRKKWLED